VVLELAGLGSLDRPMPGVMDPRRHLVREQRSVDSEQFQSKHSDVAKTIHDTPAMFDRQCGDLRSNARSGCGRFPKHTLTVDVLHGRIKDFSTVLPAHAYHRKLMLKWDKCLDDQGRSTQRFKSRTQSRFFADHHLTLPVIAETPRLEDHRQTDARHGGVQIVEAVDRSEVRRWNIERAKERFFEQSILRRLERFQRREKW